MGLRRRRTAWRFDSVGLALLGTVSAMMFAKGAILLRSNWALREAGGKLRELAELARSRELACGCHGTAQEKILHLLSGY